MIRTIRSTILTTFTQYLNLKFYRHVSNNIPRQKARKGPRINLPMATTNFYVQEYRDITLTLPHLEGGGIHPPHVPIFGRNFG